MKEAYDKLGYIVKSTLKYYTHLNKGYLFLSYIVQSQYPIKKIYKSIDEFNTIFFNEFTNNKDKFNLMFDTLKKSKLLDLNKLPNDINEETYIYLSSIINKYKIFNYKKLISEILNLITFIDIENSINDFFTNIINNNRYHIILDKSIP